MPTGTSRPWRSLILLALCCAGLLPGLARAIDCSDLPNGTLDGFAGDVAPSQIQIDRNCTIRNFPANNPLPTNFSFLTQPGQTNERWLIVFDNVVHTGQMACNAVAGHKIWFTNGSSTTIQEGCQNLLIPVEKIDKQNPPGDVATVGVPFTYRLTMPVLFDPATKTVINVAGSLNDLHGVTVIDDLNETGVDLTYLSHRAYWRSSGLDVAHTFVNNNGVLTFDNFPIVPAGEQIEVELTVVLDDTPVNAVGTQFINIARWDFGRLIDGVFYEPLPGEWGITAPMTIAAPQLVVDKTGPATANLGQALDFNLDVRNAGSSEAWDVSLVDRLPSNGDGGLCDRAPELLSAQVFQADGVTPVAGKAPLQEGVDLQMTWTGAPSCELALTIQGANGSVGAGERLRIGYRTALDPTTAQGASLTNVAGAIQWFNGDVANPQRQAYTRTVTDGTPGIDDHQDAHTLTADLSGYVFEKTVTNLTQGTDPARTAMPGDTLRYRLYLRTTDAALNGGRVRDDLGRLNTDAVFAPGTLNIVTLPPGADASATDANGGGNGGGLLDVGNLNLPLNSNATIVFDVTLAGAIDNDTLVVNQAELFGVAGKIADSDDPTVNGQADPEVAGDEDRTEVRIVSLPRLDVDKVSSYLDGDSATLLAGERIRYRITVANVGTEAAQDAMLRDAVPVNTAYVAGSTRLNGTPVADADGGISPLVDGLLLSTPADPTPGRLPVSSGADTVASIEFDVRVNADVADGYVVSNQAFVSAPQDAIVDIPSDDPRTALADDPTRDTVGNFPQLFAVKSAALLIDGNSPEIVDPGDTLRYTITTYNNGPIAATLVRLQDAVPAGTTYVADSTTLNGLALPADAGVAPLAGGIWIASTDQTPPLPDRNGATLSPREVATVTFDVRVNDDVARGTLIINQATLSSEELGDTLTDGDGDPNTGPEPTVVVVGDAQQLAITKRVAVVGGGPAVAGATLEYEVTVRNLSAVPAQGVYVTDDLQDPVPDQLLYVADSARLNGGSAGVEFNNGVLLANYSALYGPLPPGRAFTLRFRAVIEPSLAIGTSILNVAYVTWNTDQTARAEVNVDVGGTPGVGLLSGRMWHDANFDDVPGTEERSLVGWRADLLRNDRVVHSVMTDAAGVWQMGGVAPNYNTPDRYELRFVAPGAAADSAALGFADSAFTNAPQRIYDIEVRSGSNLQNLNLPIDPNGVVYDTLSRQPIPGVQLTLVDAASGAQLPADCFDDAAQQGQRTLADGYYKFDLNFSEPACTAGAAYRIELSADARYVAGIAELVAPPGDAGGMPLDVPNCGGSSDDAIPGTAQFCELQPSEFAPAGAAARYYLQLALDDSRTPASSQAFNNHLPLDPVFDGLVNVTKTTPMVNVTRGQMIPYTITVRSTWPVDLSGVDVVDRYPVGFKYVQGSARYDGQALEPEIVDGELIWRNMTLPAEAEQTVTLLLTPGAGIGEGKYVNRAFARLAQTGDALSGVATATVRVIADPTFDCTDVTGKVFEDDNRNGVQDFGEDGLPARAPADGDRSGGGYGCARAIPHYLCNHTAPGPRQQLPVEARRSHPAFGLPCLQRCGAGAARDTR